MVGYSDITFKCDTPCVTCKLARRCIVLKTPPPPRTGDNKFWFLDDKYDPMGSEKVKGNRVEWTDRLVGLELECGHLVEAPPSVRLITKDIQCYHRKCAGQFRKLKPEVKRPKVASDQAAIYDPKQDPPPF